jgi:hypothetical protein
MENKKASVAVAVWLFTSAAVMNNLSLELYSPGGFSM